MEFEAVNVLLVEDNPGDIRLVREALDGVRVPRFHLSQADRINEAERLLRTQDFDVVLLDLTLPDAIGLETISAIHEAAPNVPIVVMTGNDDDALALRAVREGVQDYLIKGRAPSDQLARTIRYAIERKRARDELQRAHDELERRVRERTASLAEANARLQQEIGQRQLAEDAVRQSEQRLQDIVDGAPTVIYVKDCQGRYMLVNRRFEELFHVQRGQLIGKSDYDVFPRDMADAFRVNDQQTLTQAGPDAFEEIAPHDDGPHTYISQKFVLRDSRNEAYAICGISTDITDRKRYEEELCKSSIAAESATQAKSEFLAKMSHELRTPLHGVIGMIELLLATQLAQVQRRYAWLAKTSCDNLLHLIDDVLDFSKIEAGKLELEVAPFDLDLLVDHLIEIHASSADAKGLELIYSIHPTVPRRLMGDSHRLHQVLNNLLANAIKFTSNGEIVVRASMVQCSGQTATIRFMVSDAGIGIPADRVDRLFHSFEQVDASTTRQYGGSGLGLAICKQIVELMGGTIGVDSQPSRGSCFWFQVTLPTHTEQGDAGSATLDHQALRILVLDDSSAQRELLCEQLTHCGMAATAVATVEQALSLFRSNASEQPFDRIIADYHLADNAVERLAQALQEDPVLSSVRLIVASTASRAPDQRRLKDLGCSGLVIKPIRPAQLLELVREPPNQGPAIESAANNRAAPGLGTLPAAAKRTDGARILIAEDNDISREVAVTILSQAGYECQGVSTGRQVVDAVHSRWFHVVLMDCQMPDMDGFEATRIIREHEQDRPLSPRDRSRLPIVALTASPASGDRERCLAAGMDDFLTKPFTSESLILTVERQLARSRSERGSEAFCANFRKAGESVEFTSSPTNPDGNTPPPFDLGALLERWDSDRQFVHNLVSKFHDQVSTDLVLVEQSIAAGRTGEVEKIAKRLVGSSDLLGAGRFRAQAEHLETLGRSRDLTDARQCLKELQAELRKCRELSAKLLVNEG